MGERIEVSGIEGHGAGRAAGAPARMRPLVRTLALAGLLAVTTAVAWNPGQRVVDAVVERVVESSAQRA
ncbi:MAG: hypothetical protein LXA50_20540, partial [Betaproteobacteria bacterium]|nr:hypothetical protein [Betaproteobacteria bacterium]